MSTTFDMSWLYQLFINAGINETAASWGATAVIVLIFMLIFYAIKALLR